MIEYEIPFVCLIFTAMISIIFFSKKKIELEENYYFKNILIFTLLVNITTYFALKKVNMIESLKSIE